MPQQLDARSCPPPVSRMCRFLKPTVRLETMRRQIGGRTSFSIQLVSRCLMLASGDNRSGHRGAVRIVSSPAVRIRSSSGEFAANWPRMWRRDFPGILLVGDRAFAAESWLGGRQAIRTQPIAGQPTPSSLASRRRLSRRAADYGRYSAISCWCRSSCQPFAAATSAGVAPLRGPNLNGNPPIFGRITVVQSTGPSAASPWSSGAGPVS